jgi:hypothetical protein
MEAVLERSRGTRGVRLLQDTFNVKSLSLYAALGFDALEFLVVLSGVPRNAAPPGWEIRNLSASDIAGCECLHASVHGYTRTNELRDALETGAPIVALRDGRVRAYMVAPTNWLANHGVAATEEDMQALLLGASQLVRGSISLLMPVRRADLFRWCLTEGYRAIRPMTLMTVGEYREPQGSSCTETDRPSLDASVMRVRPLPRHCDLPHQKDPADLASVNSAARTPATPPKTSAAFPAANDSATATVPAYRLTICVPMTARERQGRGRLTA